MSREKYGAEVGCENQEDTQGVAQNSEIDHKKRD